MQVSDFNFLLPQELIAQEPLAARDASRLLHLQRATGMIIDSSFRDLPALLRPSDLLVFNDTRVFPARLYGRRAGSDGKIEVLLASQLSVEPNEWECLVRPGKKVSVGERLSFGESGELQAEVLARGEFGQRRLRFKTEPKDGDFFSVLDRIGHIPLPPYVSRNDSAADRDRYQTVYANQRGSVAAPTAGLHFTPEILQEIHDRGIECTNITLHVGLGTFQPIRTERVEDHKIHLESYSISREAAGAISRALSGSRRVVAIGTTTVRALEHASHSGAEFLRGGTAFADIFIYPGYEFKVVGAMLTNFHLPQSSLLLLVSAFSGKEHILRAYEHAVIERYRFYSYGDCMFLE